MKKVLFIMAAALLTMTQCRKSEDSAPSEGKTVNMTVTVGPGSKTDITDTGRITWSSGDKLYVGDGSKYVGYLTLASGDEGHVTGRFTGSVELTGVKEGDELTFHFYYLGSADHTNLKKGDASVDVDFSSQDIYKNGNKLANASLQHVCYGSAKGTVKDGVVTDINVVLVSKVAIASFDFKNNGAAYTGALILRGDNIYNKMTVNFNSTGFDCEGTKGDISLTNTTTSEKYVMLVPTSSTTGSQTLTFGGDAIGTATLANGIRPNKFYGIDEAIAVTVKPVEFTVGAGTKVKFAPGNLWYGIAEGESVEAFHFEANQYDFRTYAGKTAVINGSSESTPSNHWGLFGWSTTTAYGMNISTDNNYYLGNFKDWGENSIGGYPANTWHTLTDAEWKYLLNTGGSSGRTDANRFAKARVSGVVGLLVFPDGYNNGTAIGSITGVAALNTIDAGYPTESIPDETWTSMEFAGAVFLPATGYRKGENVYNATFGYYWTGSPNGMQNAVGMNFNSNDVYTNNVYRYYGDAVRLVRSAS